MYIKLFIISIQYFAKAPARNPVRQLSNKPPVVPQPEPEEEHHNQVTLPSNMFEPLEPVSGVCPATAVEHVSHERPSIHFKVGEAHALEMVEIAKAAENTEAAADTTDVVVAVAPEPTAEPAAATNQPAPAAASEPAPAAASEPAQ
jgi:hypothetical protein